MEDFTIWLIEFYENDWNYVKYETPIKSVYSLN